MERKRAAELAQLLALLVVIAVPVLFIYLNSLPQNSAPQTETQSAPQEAPVISLDNASQLPSSVAAQQIVAFSFTVQNPGSVAGQYQYKVSVKWNSGETDVLDENVLSIPADSSADVPESVKFEQAGDIGTITIAAQGAQSAQFTLPWKN